MKAIRSQTIKPVIINYTFCMTKRTDRFHYFSLCNSYVLKLGTNGTNG